MVPGHAADAPSALPSLAPARPPAIKGPAAAQLRDWFPCGSAAAYGAAPGDSGLTVDPSCGMHFTSGQRRSFNHQIDNRSPEIDPFWYVGRGVRPIGRFGKRQLRSSHKSLRPGISSLELTVDALQEQAALDAEDDGWW
ncbi:unnamed protein product [Caretta caretta]